MDSALQRLFKDEIRGGSNSFSLGWSRVSPQQTWAIYRRNYLENHIAALRDTFAATHDLVGENYFRQIARAYVRQAQSTSGDLNNYGSDFPQFLASLLKRVPEGKDLPYLPDIARLDWACFAALMNAKGKSAWLSELLDSPQTHWDQSRVVSAGYYLDSKFPIYRIWQMTQHSDAAFSDTVAIDDTPERVLVTCTHKVQVTMLIESNAIFVQRWFAGGTLGDAVEAAMAIDDNFDLISQLTALESLQAIQSVLIETQ
jgi:Putative DNA-binding domain